MRDENKVQYRDEQNQNKSRGKKRWQSAHSILMNRRQSIMERDGDGSVFEVEG
jgi:hypothetical protein